MRCDVCQKIIDGDFSILNGKNCCSEKCLHVLYGKCYRCGTILEGQYFIIEGKEYCSQRCAKNGIPNHSYVVREQCHICKKSLTGQYILFGGKNYCSQQCASVDRPKCNNCMKPIEGQFMKIVKEREYLYCMTCCRGTECFACGRPEQGVTLSDGRFVCHQCKNISVTDKRMAQQLFNDVRATLKKLGYATCDAINFHIVDRVTMKRVSGKQYNERELGLYHNVTQTTTVSFLGIIPLERVNTSSSQCSIYVYDYIPKERFMETIAHELGHDWCRHKFGKVVFSPACEGVAEYIASRLNEAMGWEGNNQRMQNNTDPIYGNGYRMIRDVAACSGDNGIVMYMRNNLK